MVEFSLLPRRRAGLFLLALGLTSLLIAGEAIRIGIASSVEHSSNPAALRWALSFDPANPELHYRLGYVYSSSRGRTNLTEAVNHLRKATELNPRRALYWLGLSSACDSVHDTPCADQALERALALAPTTPRPQWIAANRYLVMNRTDQALPHFRRVLELSPDYNWPVFQVCLAAVGDPLLVFERVLPKGAGAKPKLDYIKYLSAQGEDDFAYRVWTETAASASPFPFSWAQPYLQHLLDVGRFKEAFGVWGDLERMGIISKPADKDPANLIFNGDFEQTPLNAGFDWRTGGAPYVEVGFADSPGYTGKRCLRLDFTVSQNQESEAVFQIVPVAPNRAYLLTAYARSDDVTSDSGPRLRVVDPVCAGCLDVSSEATVGTTPWHPVSLRFSTGAQTQAVRVSVWRPLARTFPSEISGTFWLDSTSLTEDSESKSKEPEAKNQKRNS